MPLSIPQLFSSSYGYLSGQDLVTWVDPTLIIKQTNVNPNAIQLGINTAIAEVGMKLATKYDLTSELTKSPPNQGLIVATVAGGAVTGLNLINPGSGYIGAPTVTFGGPGTGATGTATVSSVGVISIEVLKGGRRYAQPPTVYINGGGGTGATAIAVLSQWGNVAEIIVTAAGTGYTSIPTISIVPVNGDTQGGGAYAVASINLGILTGVTLTLGGSGYGTAPAVTLSGGLGNDLRDLVLVKILSLFAVRNILGNFQSLSDKLKADLAGADMDILDIRNGQGNLKLYEPGQQLTSDARLINSSFSTIG
jgi:hypothetical protein